MPITLTAKRLAQATLSTSTVTLYTVPANTVTMVRYVFATNTSGSDRTYTLYYVKSGESAQDKNTIVGGKSVTANSGHRFTQHQVLEAGDTIRAKADGGSAMALNVSGVEFTGTFDAIRPKRLVQALCSTSIVTAYTTPAGKKAMVKQITFTNVTGSGAAVRLDLVPSGQSPSTSTQIYSARSVGANGIQNTSAITLLLTAGDTLRVSADTRNAIAVHISGMEETL